jgi:serine/threonine-protein kinase
VARSFSGSGEGQDAPPPEPVGDLHEVIAGKYRLIRMLGQGGMGEVWEAENVALNARVAVKLVRSPDPILSERMVREAQAAARLVHPAIVRVFDLGVNAGKPFVVMELLDGEDLGSVLERHEKIGPVAAIRTLLPIAHALVTAHANGVVHRDIKPENIFLVRANASRQPKLVDFGVAKVMDSREQITRFGAMVGSPAYVSPEQAMGDPVDHRSDVWSFCIVAYELAVGRLPFDGETVDELLRAILQAPAIPGTTFGLDESLSRILSRGLAKAREARWQSMAELGSKLASWLLERQVTTDVADASLVATWSNMFDTADKAPATHKNTLELLTGDRVALGAPPAEIAVPRPEIESRRTTGSTSTPAVANARPSATTVATLGAVVGVAIAGAAWWVLNSHSTEPVPAASDAVVVPASPVPAAAAVIVAAPASTRVAPRDHDDAGASGAARARPEPASSVAARSQAPAFVQAPATAQSVAARAAVARMPSSPTSRTKSSSEPGSRAPDHADRVPGSDLMNPFH